MAPELRKAILEGESSSRYSQKADVYSLGAVAYALYKRGPFKAKGTFVVQSCIANKTDKQTHSSSTLLNLEKAQKYLLFVCLAESANIERNQTFFFFTKQVPIDFA